jgi:PHD/YefM family antitoxin component YafN of YafNO toxin-antitoxin module
MKVYSYSEAREKLSATLEESRTEEVVVTNGVALR